MADNVVLNAGSGGDTVAADDVNGVKYQLVQLVTGADGAAKSLVSGANGLPVAVGGTVVITGAITDAELRATPVPVSGTVAVTGTFWQATQPVSGPLTDTQLRATPVPVSGGLTDAEIRASAVPVSLASVPTHAVSTVGSITNPVTVLGVVVIDTSGGAVKVHGAESHDSTSSAWPVLAGAYASTAAPTAVSADGDAVRLWADRNGRLQVGDGGGSLTVDGPVTDAQLRATAVPVSATSLPLPAGASTLAEQQAQTASLSVMDDWDESDRAKVNPIAGQAGVQGGAGASTALTQRIAIATDANTVDTELPAAAALSDALANPTTPQIGSNGLLWDATNTQWVRKPAPTDLTLLASAARTATTASSSQTNYGARGVLVMFAVTVVPGAGTISFHLQAQDPISGGWVTLNQTPPSVGAGGAGLYGMELSPGASGGTGAAPTLMLQRISGTLPRVWRINVVASSANSFTYSVAATLLR